MASPHHHHFQKNHLTSCCCHCSCTSSHPSSASQPPSSDLLQAIAPYLLQSSQAHLYTQCLKPQQQQQQQYQEHLYQKQQHQYQHHQQIQSLISSLLRRIDALESSLHHFSAASPPPPSISLRHIAARIIQTHFRAFLVRRSRSLRHLKDLAIIKSSLNSLKSFVSNNTHLKPEILSQKAMDLLLKLDSIKGGDPMIRDGKRSISIDLVRFLEFVDGLSMRRRELSSKTSKNARLAENIKKSSVFISTRDPFRSGEIAENGVGTYHQDLCGVQRACLEKLSSKIRSNQGSSSEEEEAHVELEAFHQRSDDENPKNLNDGGILVKRHGISSKAKKKVSFADYGNSSRVFISTHESFPAGDDAGIDQRFPDDDQRELVENFCKEVEESGGFSRVSEDDDEAHMENEVCHQISDGDRNPGRDVQNEVNYGIRAQYQAQNSNFTFSAPLPVQMESIIRTDLMKKKDIVR